MKSISKSLLPLLFLALFFQPTTSFAKWAGWGSLKIKHKYKEKKSVYFKHTQKWSEFDKLGTYYFQLGASRKFVDWFRLGKFYRFQRKLKSGKFKNEHRLALEPTFKWKWGNFKFSDRNRIEYRIFDSAPNTWRYRNKLKIAHAVDVFGYEIVPFISNEFFYDFGIGEFNQNRASLGFGKKLTDSMVANLYYIYVSTKKKKKWSGGNVLGLALTCKI